MGLADSLPPGFRNITVKPGEVVIDIRILACILKAVGGTIVITQAELDRCKTHPNVTAFQTEAGHLVYRLDE